MKSKLFGRVNKKIYLIVISLLMLAALLLLGPLDKFTHGYYYDEPDLSLIPDEDIYENINIADTSAQLRFVADRDHFAGFEIYRAVGDEPCNGSVVITITDNSGNVVDIIREDASLFNPGSWYKLYVSHSYKKGCEYSMLIATEGCDGAFNLMCVNPSYLDRNITDGNIMLTMAYARSTFNPQEKVLISVFIIALWLFVCGMFVQADSDRRLFNRRNLLLICAGVFLTAVMSWNFMYNSMDNQNTSFDAFQVDSETLVSSVIWAEQDPSCIRNVSERGYGLGRYYDLKGELSWYGQDYKTDADWLKGYSRDKAAIIVASNLYSSEVVAAGHYVTFADDTVCCITDVEDNGDTIIAYLDADAVLNPFRNGSLDDAVFTDEEFNVYGSSQMNAYRSQVGLQGTIFRHLARYMEKDQIIPNLNLICAVITAIVFTLIVMLIAVKYNPLMAGVFYVTFWLSPWIVNFARNLYWVEFTWFLPMMFGLFVAWKLDSRVCRIIGYAGAFLSVLVKCLCGYEYISVIMMGMIVFLLSDFVLAIVRKDSQKTKTLFWTIAIMGVMAVAGFMMAIFVHAPIKGDGSFVTGLKNIFEQDVLRRTAGGNLNAFDEEYWPSFNASLWETFAQYFHFKTEIILGITGNLFAVLCLAPLGIFAYEIKQKRVNAENMALYIISFLTTVSWFVLAKGHSYIHTHMSYVLWYFGYVQMCLYIIISKFIGAISKGEAADK